MHYWDFLQSTAGFIWTIAECNNISFSQLNRCKGKDKSSTVCAILLQYVCSMLQTLTIKTVCIERAGDVFILL